MWIQEILSAIVLQCKTQIQSIVQRKARVKGENWINLVFALTLLLVSVLCFICSCVPEWKNQ